MKATRACQTPQDDDANWSFDREDLELSFNFLAGDCGQRKTEWLIDRIANKPDRYDVCLPRIDHIREVVRRLRKKHGDIETAFGYRIETIQRGWANEVVGEDDVDEPALKNLTVTQQAEKFLKEFGNRRQVVLFITHAALLLTSWWRWSQFHLMVDEIPEPYQTYSRDFRKTSDYVRSFIRPGRDATETN